jgi:hypothetical protein
LELARAGSLEPARGALRSIAKPADARAEALSPEEFERFAEALGERGGES